MKTFGELINLWINGLSLSLLLGAEEKLADLLFLFIV